MRTCLRSRSGARLTLPITFTVYRAHDDLEASLCGCDCRSKRSNVKVVKTKLVVVDCVSRSDTLLIISSCSFADVFHCFLGFICKLLITC